MSLSFKIKIILSVVIAFRFSRYSVIQWLIQTQILSNFMTFLILGFLLWFSLIPLYIRDFELTLLQCFNRTLVIYVFSIYIRFMMPYKWHTFSPLSVIKTTIKVILHVAAPEVVAVLRALFHSKAASCRITNEIWKNREEL